jgi:hypothetical protein
MFRTASYLSAVVISGLLLTGCDSSSSTNGTSGGGHVHDHPSEGPHHGQLIELGNEQYHGELLHDDATNTVTVYILDGAAKELVPIPEQEVTLQLLVGEENKSYTLTAVPDAADSEAAAKFEVVDAELGRILDEEHELKGRLQVNIGGTQFTGSFEHTEHAHDHEHGHDGGHDDEPGHDEDADHSNHGDEDADGHGHPEGDQDM